MSTTSARRPPPDCETVSRAEDPSAGPVGPQVIAKFSLSSEITMPLPWSRAIGIEDALVSGLVHGAAQAGMCQGNPQSRSRLPHPLAAGIFPGRFGCHKHYVGEFGHSFDQKRQALGPDFEPGIDAHSRNIAAGARQAGYQAKTNWVSPGIATIGIVVVAVFKAAVSGDPPTPITSGFFAAATSRARSP